MDLDRDGRADVLSGSYQPGELFVFTGLADGGLAAGRRLLDAEGKPIRVGRASWPRAVDWDGDGDLDLVIGNMYGKVFLARNTSGGAGLAWSAPVPLRADGKDLEITETNAAPCIADWDGDGAHDLLLGSGEGQVLLYRNTAAHGEPVLAAPTELLPPSPEGGNAVRMAHPGVRSRVDVVDWNGDGRLDLLVGEYACEDGDPPPLSVEDRRRLDVAIKESVELGQRRGALEQAAFERWLGEHSIAPAQASEHYEDFLAEWQLTDEALTLTRRLDELASLQRHLNPLLIEHGRVWVFLRRATSTGSR